MNDRIHELLHRSLQEVFGEGDAARRRAAIDELYTEDCLLDVPPGTFVGRAALGKFAGDPRATHPHFVYTRMANLRPSTMPVVWLGVSAARRSARLHGLGCDHRSRWQDGGALRRLRFHAFIAATALILTGPPTLKVGDHRRRNKTYGFCAQLFSRSSMRARHGRRTGHGARFSGNEVNDCPWGV
jgi:hypothetical protein